MRRPTVYILVFILSLGSAARGANDLRVRVTACVRWLSSSAAARSCPSNERASDTPDQHNARVLREYRRAQDFEVMRYGIEHSALTRYVSVLPELVELFLRRNPERHRLNFVVNSGDQPLFAADGHGLVVYPPYDVLVVWRDSSLVFRHLPAEVLDQLLWNHAPEKFVLRAISNLDSGFAQDDEKLTLTSSRHPLPGVGYKPVPNDGVSP